MPGCTRRAALATLASALALPGQPARTLSARLLETGRESIMLLAALSRENQILRTATAFQLDESTEFISTAAALRDAVKVLLVAPEGRRYPVDTVLLDATDTGLARLSAKVPEYARRGIAVAQTLAGEDDRVFVPCFSTANTRLLVEGTIASFRSSLDFGSYYRVLLQPPPDAVLEAALPVMSASGELVGVITRRLLARRNLFFAVPARRLPRREQMPTELPDIVPTAPTAPAKP